MRNLIVLLALSLCVLMGGCASKSEAANLSIAPAEGEVTAYLIGRHMHPTEAKAALLKAGFEVVAEYKMKKIGTTMVFTNKALQTMADRPTRGFAAVLRLFIDDERKQTSITNPVYFGKAFMQDEYDHSLSSGMLAALNREFHDLKPSEDKWEFDELADYHFMVGMPYYTEVDTLAEGDQATLLEQARKYKKGKNLIFEVKLSDNRMLLGYKLGKKTAKFTKKIGTQNSAVLPYTILIEDGKATALAAKYYLAISYPRLTMGEFMTIATVPGAIEKDLSKPFKKR